MRILHAMALVGGVLALSSVGRAYVETSIPARAGYRLTAACVWEAKPWVRAAAFALGASDPSPRRDGPSYARRMVCYRGLGLKSHTPFVKTMLRRWPSKAEIAAWEEHDHEGSGALS